MAATVTNSNLQLPDLIFMPSSNGISCSGDYIRENKTAYTDYTVDKHGSKTMLGKITFAGDARFDQLIDFSKTIGAIIGKNDDAALAGEIAKLNQEAIKTQKEYNTPDEQTFSINSDFCTKLLKSDNPADKEYLASLLFQYKQYALNGPYDQNIGANLQNVNKAERAVERRMVEASFTTGHIARQKASAYEEANKLYTAASGQLIAADKQYANADAEDKTEYTRNFGRGEGEHRPGFVCRHSALEMAAMMSTAGFPCHTIPCFMVTPDGEPGPHLSVISDVTGHVPEAVMPLGQTPYLYNTTQFSVAQLNSPQGGDVVLCDDNGNVNSAYSTKQVHSSPAYDYRHLQSADNLASKNFILEKMQSMQDLMGQTNSLAELHDFKIADPRQDPRSMSYQFNPERVRRTMLDNYRRMKIEDGVATQGLVDTQYALANAGALKILPDVITVGYYPDPKHIPTIKEIPVIAEGDAGHMEGAITMAAARKFLTSATHQTIEDIKRLKHSSHNHIILASDREIDSKQRQIDNIINGKALPALSRDESIQALTTLVAQSSGTQGGIKSPKGRFDAAMALERVADYAKQGHNLWDDVDIEASILGRKDVFDRKYDEAMKNYHETHHFTRQERQYQRALIKSHALDYTVKYVCDCNIALDSPEVDAAYSRALNYLVTYHNQFPDLARGKAIKGMAALEQQKELDEKLEGISEALSAAGEFTPGLNLAGLVLKEQADAGLNPVQQLQISQQALADKAAVHSKK